MTLFEPFTYDKLRRPLDKDLALCAQASERLMPLVELWIQLWRKTV